MTSKVVTKVEHEGLTHECDDPNCHVPGFVETMKKRNAERFSGIKMIDDETEPS